MESQCPLRKSCYCSICAKYGHYTIACPAKPSRLFCEPIYVEQLISPSDLKEFQITTQTLLPQCVREEPQALLEIKDDNKVISAYLSARSIKNIGGISKLRHTLEEYAKTQNKRVVLFK